MNQNMKVVHFSLLLVLFLLFVTSIHSKAANLPTATNVTAKHIGPAVGGAMFAIAIHPTDKNNIFFSGDMGVVYHTIDGGQTWSIVPNMYRIRFIKFDPNNPNIIWAGGESGLYKSTDGGVNWNFSFTTYAAFNFTLGSIAIDPTDSNIIYVAEGFVPYLKVTWVRGRVFKSTDGGATWQNLTRPGGQDPSQDSVYNRNYSSIVIDPNSSYTAGKGHSRLYLMGRDGLFKTEDYGNSWQNITFFDEGQGSDLILVNQNNQSTLICSVTPIKNHLKKGIYKSVDNGATWQVSNLGLETIVNALEIRNKDIRNATLFPLLLAYSPSNKNKIYAGSWQGIAKSTNLAGNWVQTTPSETPYVQHRSGAYVQVPLSSHPNQINTFIGGIDNFIKMKVAPNDSNFVVFTDNQDIHFSTDGGITWKSRTFDYRTLFVDPNYIFTSIESNAPKNRYTHKIESRGVQGLVNTSVAIDPFNPNIYYATYMDVGLVISRDKGISWEHPTDGLPPRGHAWSVVVDPNNEGVLWVSTGNSQGEVYKSNDKGLTWTNVSINIMQPTGKVNKLLFDKNNNILYAMTDNKGLFKSSDGGQSWQQILSQNTFDLKLDPLNSMTLYAGTLQGVYKSSDGGNSWSQLGGSVLGKVYRISVGINNRIYVVANKYGERYDWQDRYLYSSTNQGVNFNNITPLFMHKVGAVAVNPTNPDQVYIATYSTSQKYQNDKMVMARSNDGGTTWENLVDNFAFALGHDIYIDPSNTNHLFYNTNFSLIELNTANQQNSSLVANAGNDIILHRTESNRAVHLDGSASLSTNGNIVSYKWYEGTTYIGGNAQRWYVPNGLGQHIVTLKVTNSNGDVAIDTVQITVLSTTSANAGQDFSVTTTPSNPTVTLDGTASVGSIVSYEWFDSNGTSLGTGAQYTFTPPDSGLYTLTLTVTDSQGNTASDSVNVDVTKLNNNPTTTIQANAGADTTLVTTPSNRAIYLDGSNSFAVNGIVSYKWYDNNTYIGQNKTRWYVPTTTGVHDIKLVIIDTQGNSSVDHMNLTVN